MLYLYENKLYNMQLNGDVFVKKLLFKKPFFLSVASASALCVVLRFWQLAYNIEKDSGFYKNAADIGRIIFVVILALSLIFGFVWHKIVKKKAILPINLKFDFTPLFSERILFAAVAVGFAVNTFYEIFRIKNPMPSLLLPGTITAFSVITTIFSALSMAFFVILCFMIDNKQLATSFLSVVSVVFVAFRLLRDFISFTSVIYVSKNLMDLLYLCALIATLFGACRLLCASDTRKGYDLFTFFSPVTIVMGFVLSVPAILAYLCGFEVATESDMFMHFVDLTLSVFLLRFSMYVYAER